MNFENTIAALAVYDQSATFRQRCWDRADHDEAARFAEEADKEALKLVQDALYEDTKHINSRDHCRLADIGFMRAVVEDLPMSEPEQVVSIEDRIGGWRK